MRTILGQSLFTIAAILVASFAQAQQPPFESDLGELLEPGVLDEAPLMDEAPALPDDAPDAESFDDLVLEPDVAAQDADDGEIWSDEEPLLSEDFSEGGFASWLGNEEMRPGRSSYTDWMLEGNSPWYASADATFYDRESSRPVTMTFIDTTIIVSNIIFPISPAVQTAKTLGFDFQPGLRVTLGRDLYRDVINRRHSFEFTFTGLNEWSSDDTVYGEREQLLLFNPLFFGEAGTLDALFPQQLGGFNFADLHHIEYSSYMNNYEWNYRVRRRLGKDSKVLGCDGVWRKEFSPGMTPSFLIGVRHMSIGEQFSLFSRGMLESFLSDPPVENPFTGTYYVSTRNNLIGVQGGGDMVWQHARWNVGFGGKAGLYLNIAEQTSQVAIRDPIFNPNFDRFTRASTAHGAFIGDFNLTAAYRITPRLLARVSYDFMWVAGLALAPEQFDFTLAGAPVTGLGGHTTFQGVTLGAEFTW